MLAIRSITSLLTYGIGLCGILPLFPWLTWFPRTAVVAGIIAGVWQDRRGEWPLKVWLQNSLIVPIFIYYALQFSRTNPIQPVVSVLAIMLAVRLGGEKTVRHSQQIYALSIFCLASSSLYDLSPVFLMYLGILLFAIALALVLVTFQNQDQAMMMSKPDLKRITIAGLLMPLLAIPLLLLFFPVLPRTYTPLWHFLNPPATGTTGYSDVVEPGSHSSISESHTLAFRAEMPRQEVTKLYWRGIIFNRTDGTKWTRTPDVPFEQPEFADSPISQTIYPEPSATRTLIALDRPSALILPRIKNSPDGVFERSGGAGKRLAYSSESHPNGLTRLHHPINRKFYLQLPGHLPPRVVALAGKISRSGTNDRDRLEYLEAYFRNGSYRYSTRELSTGDRALEQFLFDKKQGNCEFFASSFALLLRAAGVPCRLVGGYLGGEYNQLGGYYLVINDKAHVWVEAYIEGSGWKRIDPSGFALNAGDVWKPTGTRSLKVHLQLALDSFNHSWNRSVIAYDFDQQMKAARLINQRLQGVSPTKLIRNSAPYFAAICLLAFIWITAQRMSLFLPREQRILKRFLKLVDRGGPTSNGQPANSGLFEIASAAYNQHVTEFVSIYAGAVYRDRRVTDEEYAQLQYLIDALKREEVKIS